MATMREDDELSVATWSNHGWYDLTERPLRITGVGLGQNKIIYLEQGDRDDALENTVLA